MDGATLDTLCDEANTFNLPLDERNRIKVMVAMAYNLGREEDERERAARLPTPYGYFLIMLPDLDIAHEFLLLRMRDTAEYVATLRRSLATHPPVEGCVARFNEFAPWMTDEDRACVAIEAASLVLSLMALKPEDVAVSADAIADLTGHPFFWIEARMVGQTVVSQMDMMTATTIDEARLECVGIKQALGYAG
jgi:hypothetical protein